MPKEKSLFSNPLFYVGLVVCALFLFFLYKKRDAFSVGGKLKEIYKNLVEGINSINSLKQKKAFWFHTFVIWACYFIMTYVMFFCLKETQSITINETLLIFIFGSLGMIIPTPGGVGSYHGAIIMAFTLLGYSHIYGMAVAFLIHTFQYLLGLTTGLIGFLLLALPFSKSN
ncbi:MAG: hypothetical protein C4K58_00100 [Flavobacteriaceae bacterium]|nr:MAG: hypothetical protein C4K58_00100 [Flavobacteriaceae bacterium]